MIFICIRARVRGFDAAPHVRYAAYVRQVDLPPDLDKATPAPPEPLFRGKGRLFPAFYSFLPSGWDRSVQHACWAGYLAVQEACGGWGADLIRMAFPEAPAGLLAMWSPCALPDACVHLQEPAGLAERRHAAKMRIAEDRTRS